jgi:hypothetical protein
MTPNERITYNREQIERVVLTEEEIKNAMWEGKVKKYFKDKHAEHWIEKESIKPGKEVAKTL